MFLVGNHALLHSIKLSGYKMGIEFDKDLLSVEQNDYLTKIVNVYIVYDLAAWLRNLIDIFKFKNCLFRATNIVKNSDNEKCVYSRFGIILDSAGSWSFENDFVKNDIIFGIDNSPSSHFEDCKNYFLILSEGPTSNGGFGSPEKKFSVNFTKTSTQFV